MENRSPERQENRLSAGYGAQSPYHFEMVGRRILRIAVISRVFRARKVYLCVRKGKMRINADFAKNYGKEKARRVKLRVFSCFVRTKMSKLY